MSAVTWALNKTSDGTHFCLDRLVNECIPKLSFFMTPFLKWPGGKRWLVRDHPHLVPSKYRTYYEPFLGGGSVFFALTPRRAVLSDCNADLIAFYQAVRHDAAAVERCLRRHQTLHCEGHYYTTRDIRRTRRPHTTAARFLYLNRTCFNGIYRVNRYGVFNVPKGTKDAVLLPTDDFAAAQRLLRRARLVRCDFEEQIDRAKLGDLVFADPPYTVRHNNNGFVKYNEKLFSWADQERLARVLRQAADRGVQVVLTNADHDEVRALYPQPRFRLDEVQRYSSISSDSSSRRAYRELVIRANCD